MIVPLSSSLKKSKRHFESLKAISHDVSVKLYESKNPETVNRATKMSDCCQFLQLVKKNDEEKFVSNSFCRVRLCPTCQWRRSLKLRARIFESLPDLAAQKNAYIFLTLTVRNCGIADLRDTLKKMSNAWVKMLRYKRLKGVIRGFLRSVEITRNKQDGTAHPHYHALIAVSPSYFKNATYVKKIEWAQLWAKALKIDYIPIVDVRRVKPQKDLEEQLIADGVSISGVLEVTKYTIKNSDLADSDARWLCELDVQISGTRAVSFGGCIADALKLADDRAVDDFDGDLDDVIDSQNVVLASFFWDTIKKAYVIALPPPPPKSE